MQIVRASFALAAAAMAVPALAATQFSADFGSYANGNLVGQGGWAQSGASATAPLQVASGKVVLPGFPASASNTDNQDAIASFAAVPNTAGTSLYLGATITVNTAYAPNTTVGSSFLLALNTTDPFSNLRVVTRLGSSAGTFQLGFRATGQAANQPVWTGNLTYGTAYNFVFAWNFVAGAQNDTLAGYLNPVGPIGSNVPFATTTQSNATGDAPGFNGVIISQFANATTSQSDARIGRVIVANTFAEAASFVPAPGTAALMGLGLVAAGRRRR